uniref:Vanadium-dependent bromoperoxidase n=1 Tax=Laurencia okamurae TaxID=2510711 RepID=A0A7G1K7W0_9FLOR|nr:vanadium-dependent bromoperoxidase [Laurencia okamurae]BCK50961.1 vanadium-dependent bromoperoxidase [Laurencia okamurae]
MEHYTHIQFDWARRNATFDVRLRTAVQSRDAIYSGDDGHVTNGDEARFPATLLGTFTKGLPHSLPLALPTDRSAFDAFVSGVNTGDLDTIKSIPLGPDPEGDNSFSSSAMTTGAKVRGWESMAAGLAFTLEAPDPQRVTMPPAPQIDSVELGYELSESYWMALCRDIAFTEFDNSDTVAEAAASMAAHAWVSEDGGDQLGELTPTQTAHRELEMKNGQGITQGTIFRGSLNGDNVGPYLSQFLLIGCDTLGSRFSTDDPESYLTGRIRFGAHRIDQRVRKAVPNRDYMTTWGAYIDVANGADVRGRESYVPAEGDNELDEETHRFIHTPRDLATYVHYDALYQPYFNACLLMLAMGIGYDAGLPFGDEDEVDKQTGFALFGGPHILSLLAEVVLKALKAVRFQKFAMHRRARPETVAGWIDCVQRPRTSDEQEGDEGQTMFKPIEKLCEFLDSDLLQKVREHNTTQNNTQFDNDVARLNDYDPVDAVADCGEDQQEEQTEDEGQQQQRGGTYLLPMAYAEGSPMHPAYGAGHATVAGACTTILKAFFDTTQTMPYAFTSTDDGTKLTQIEVDEALTVEGELNKLCSNISIGRNWAGVHWKSDYTESIKLGEEIAIGLLREQKNVYAEDFSMTIPLFDGSSVTV